VMQVLRPYQNEAVAAVFDAIEDGYTRILYTQATGTGKTTVFADLVKNFIEYYNYKVLILAHRRELITQAYERITAHCDLDDYQVGIELAETKSSHSNQVVIGSVFSVVIKGRMPNWKPDVIITDECHRAAAPTYKKIFERFGVFDADAKCISIGCTATAKRTDKKSLYATNIDESPVTLFDKKTKQRIPADPNTSVYEKHAYDFSILDAIESGWLVPVVGHAVRTGMELEYVDENGEKQKVETDTDGDFKEGQLAKAVDNLDRTMLAINAWKQKAHDRPTIVFCAGVEHAYHTAELWRQAGFTAQALGGEEAQDSYKRGNLLNDFKSGRLQVLCNMGLFTEGTDLPTASCIVHLRPTKSWNLYVQMSGRGTRPLSGVLDQLQEFPACDRRAAISFSAKPNCLIIDLVDLCKNNDLCAVPSILDLPADLDLEGESITDAKKLLDEFEEVKDRVIGECPRTYRDLKARLEEVNLLRNSGAKSTEDWKTTPEGYRFARVPVGYKADLKQEEDGNWRLTVESASSGPLLNRKGKPGGDMKAYLDSASHHIGRVIEEHRKETPKGTLDRLSTKQIFILNKNGHPRGEVDCMPIGYAKKLVAKYAAEYYARMAQQQAS